MEKGLYQLEQKECVAILHYVLLFIVHTALGKQMWNEA